MTYLWLTASVLCFGVGEYASKLWTKTPSVTGALLITLPYAIGALLWLPAILREPDLGRVGTAWAVMSALVTLGVGLFCFGEVLSLKNWFGIAFAILALVFLS